MERRLAAILAADVVGYSRMMGVDLTYECLNSCTIRVYLRAYRDCTGASGITNTINFNAHMIVAREE